MEKTKMKNRRKIFYDDKTKLVFGGYIFFTFILALFLAVKLLANIGFQMFSPGFSGPIFTFKPGILVLIFILWTLFGYFFAYIYATDKIHGIVFRMGRFFDRISDKEITRLSFRADDPFKPVADSFNRMLDKMCHKASIKTELQTIALKAEDETKKRLEALIHSL